VTCSMNMVKTFLLQYCRLVFIRTQFQHVLRHDPPGLVGLGPGNGLPCRRLHRDDHEGPEYSEARRLSLVIQQTVLRGSTICPGMNTLHF
jgi:hypothetical protein